MCQPIIQNVTFDQATYSPGQTITASVVYVACCSGPFTITGADTGNRTWTLVASSGNLATLTAVA